MLSWFGDLNGGHLVDRSNAVLLAKLGVELLEWPRLTITHGFQTLLYCNSILVSLDEIENILVDVGKARSRCLRLNVGGIGKVDLHDSRYLYVDYHDRPAAVKMLEVEIPGGV